MKGIKPLTKNLLPTKKTIRPITRGLGAIIGGTILYDRITRGYEVGKRQGNLKYIKIITDEQYRQLTSNHDSHLWNGLQRWWFRSTLDNNTIPGILKVVYGAGYAVSKLFDMDTLIPLGLAFVSAFSKSKLGIISLGILGVLGFDKALRVTGIKNQE